MATLIEEEEDLEPEYGLDRKDLLLAVRKIMHYVEEKVKGADAVRKKDQDTLQTAVKDLVQEVKNLRQELSQRDQKAGELSSSVDQLAAEQKSLRDYWTQKADSLHKSIFDKYEERAAGQEDYMNKKLDMISREHGSEIDSVNKAFNLGIQSAERKFLDIVKAMPIPQVHNVFPEHAIKIMQSTPEVTVHVPQQAPPSVNVNPSLTVSDKSFNLHVEQPAPHVHLPEHAIQIKMEPSTVNVAVPEQPAPQVNMTVPQQQAPQVHVNMPRRKVKKTIEYLPDGRPGVITEEEIFEEDEKE